MAVKKPIVYGSGSLEELQAGDTLAPPVVGLANTAYVSTAGNDGTAVLGNEALPFSSIQAALNALVPGVGGAVVIGPGTYTEDLVVPDLPRVAIVGSGVNVTFVESLAGTVLTYVAGAPGDESFLIQDISLSAAGALPAIVFDGNGQTDFCFDCEFYAVRVSAGAATPPGTFKQMNNLNFRQASIVGSALPIVLDEVTLCFFLFAAVLTGVDIGWDEAAPLPATPRLPITFIASRLGDILGFFGGTVGLNLRNQAAVTVDADTVVTNISDTGLSYDGAGLVGPQLRCYGQIGISTLPATGVVTLALPAIPAAPSAAFMVFDFSGATFFNDNAVTFTVGGAIAFTILARRTLWYQVTPGIVSIGALLNLEALGSTFSAQAAFAVVGSGTMDRSRWLVLGTVNPGGGVPIPFLPYPNAIYQANVSPFGGGPIAWGIAAKAPALVQVIMGGGGGVIDLEIVRSP